jgi:hypothetical protein
MHKPNSIARETAIRASAIGDNLAAERYFTHRRHQLVNRDRAGPGHILSHGPHIEDEHISIIELVRQFTLAYLLDRAAAAEIGNGQLIHFIEVVSGHRPDTCPETLDLTRRKAVIDPGPLPTRHHQAGRGKTLEMMRGIRDTLAYLQRQALHMTLVLGQNIDQLGPAAARQSLGDSGKPLEQSIFCPPITHIASLSSITRGELFKHLLDKHFALDN